MKRILSLILVLLLMPCIALADACPTCGGDKLCNTCGGAGYQTVTLYGSNQKAQIACTAGCNHGACPDCVQLCPICFGDRVCDACGGAGYGLMTVYGSNEPIQIACSAGCNVGACPNCIVECAVCGSDGLCDACGGLAYTTAPAYGSNEMLKIACMGENCRQGFCAACMPELEDRFALVAAAVNEVTAAPTPAPTATPEPTRTPKPTPTLVPSGQAVFGDGTEIAGLELYSNGEFYLKRKGTWAADSPLSAAAGCYKYEPRPIFDGSIVSFAREYADALVESGYYVLVEEKEYTFSSSTDFNLSYAYPGRISPCDELMLDGFDLVITVNQEDEYILFSFNPALTIRE